MSIVRSPSSMLLAVTILAAGAGMRRPGPQPAPVDPRWLDRLDPLDRRLLGETVGFAPPPFAADLAWKGTAPLSWDDVRGRVVLVQSWTSRRGAGRGWLERATRALEDVPASDLQIVALHTPEGADEADAFLDARPVRGPVAMAVDRSGAFCDALGLYRRPANLLVDRNGQVRFAGLNLRGLREAVSLLVAELHDPDHALRSRPGPPFPPFEGNIHHARDLRGQRGPDVGVERWLNGVPDLTGKLVVIDFWATWCKPCIASVPHLNRLARRFEADVVIVGVSDEPYDRLIAGIDRDAAVTVESFGYFVALDTAARMKGDAGVTAIPHALVLSRDRTVRWQGHPTGLTEEILGEIVAADGGLPAERRRWTGGTGGTGGTAER